jgi:hypothetical protein
LLVIELKRDTLDRGAITQLVDYYGMLKSRFSRQEWNGVSAGLKEQRFRRF